MVGIYVGSDWDAYDGVSKVDGGCDDTASAYEGCPASHSTADPVTPQSGEI